jgi:hypothetical protein
MRLVAVSELAAKISASNSAHSFMSEETLGLRAFSLDSIVRKVLLSLSRWNIEPKAFGCSRNQVH